MTTPVPVPKLLKEYLDHLDKDGLKEFQWYLWQIEINGSRPIPISKLPKNSTRVETVDKLVEAFGEDGAVKWTVDTFFEMKCKDLASKLVQAKMDQSREQKEDEPETSSAREKPREVDPTVLKDLFCFLHVVLQRGHSFCRSCVHKDWQTPPENIREKEAFENVKQLRDSPVERIKTQSYEEKQIIDQYKRLRALLDKEEKTRLAALRKETRQKIHVTNWIADMTEDTFLLSDTNEETGTSRSDTIFIEVCMVSIISVLLAVWIGWTIYTMTVSKQVKNLLISSSGEMGNNIHQTPVVCYCVRPSN